MPINESDIVGQARKKYKELELDKMPPKEPMLPRGARPVPEPKLKVKFPFQEKVSPLQRQIRKRILPRVKIA